MDSRLQRRIQRYGWDKAAAHYEDGWHESLAEVQDRLIALAAAQPGETALDIACGTGLVTFPIAEQVTQLGRVIATDISAAMVEQIRVRADSYGMDHVDAFRADAESLADIADDSVDLVTCALGLMYFADPQAALREFWRVLKPGGRLVAAVWGARRNCGWADIFPIVDSRVNSAVCPMFFHLGTGDMLSHAYSEAEFVEVRSERLSTNLPYATDQAALDAAFLGGPVALAYDRFSEVTQAEANAEYLNSISSYWTAEGYRIPGEFVLAFGRKPLVQ